MEPNQIRYAQTKRVRVRQKSELGSKILRSCFSKFALAVLIGGALLLTLLGGIFAVYAYLFTLVVERLHISWTVAVIFLPFFLFSLSLRGKSGYVTQLKLDHINIPLYRFSQKTVLGFNLIGGLIPVAIALYQIVYSPELMSPAAILTTVVAIMTYTKVKVRPSKGIYIPIPTMLLICLIAAILSYLLIPLTPERLDVSIAFAGAVLGCLIGADILHTRDLKIAQHEVSMSIGGAGRQDGIFLMGIWALLFTEWLPGLWGLLAQFPV